ncbi:hypothetical protein JQ543_30710 [Bradyrhizobium diazoefficiens]|nr:hypothetical protein [Bradyrhizobium diazoefficiens]MBR0852142.1 hypothetical protein [Bradyrhizobium diazoefficiens]
MTYEALDKDGKPIAGRAVPDGGRVRVPAMIMDTASAGTLHRPGSLPLADADRDRREAALADRDRRLSEAWKQPAPAQIPADAKPGQTTPPAAVAGASDAAARYAGRCAALETAWRRA